MNLPPVIKVKTNGAVLPPIVKIDNTIYKVVK